MRLCCNLFSQLVANADQAGISVIGVKGDYYRWFELVARACSQADEDRLSASVTNLFKEGEMPRFLRIETRIGIAYCPFCGTHLADFITANQNEFDQQARSE
jgi:hypothetical protein